MPDTEPQPISEILPGYEHVVSSWAFLRNYNHDGTENFDLSRLSPADHLEKTRSSLQELLTLQNTTSSAATRDQIAQLAVDLSTTLEGYAYRAEHRLPGVASQVDTVQAAIVAQPDLDLDQALTVLRTQPDTSSDVTMLSKLHAAAGVVRDAGGRLDLHALESEVRSLRNGIEVNPEWVLEARMAEMDQMALIIRATAPLAEAQNKPEIINALLYQLDELRTTAMLECADNLDSSLIRLEQSYQLKSAPEEAEKEHNERLKELYQQRDTREMLSEVFNWLCLRLGLDPNETYENGLDGIRLLNQAAKLESLIAGQREEAGVDSFIDELPIVGPRRQSRRSAIEAQADAYTEERRRLLNVLESRQAIEKLRQFMDMEMHRQAYTPKMTIGQFTGNPQHDEEVHR